MQANSRKLLTKELVQKIEQRARNLLDIASGIWPDHIAKFNDAPCIRYDIKNTFGGVATSGGKDDWTIRLNLILCHENEEHFIEQTVGHEVAHLIQHVVYGFTTLVENKQTGKREVKKIRPHGKEWKEVMTKLGLPSKTTHTYDVSSIQTKPRPRALKGAILSKAEVKLMMKRLSGGYKRLPPEMMLEFMCDCFMKLDDVDRKDLIAWMEDQ